MKQLHIPFGGGHWGVILFPSASIIMEVKATGLPMNKVKPYNKDCLNYFTLSVMTRYFNLHGT